MSQLFDLTVAADMPGYPVDAPSRIRKAQIYCRRCHREVRETQQTGLQCGRRIIVCKFICHGEEGEIRICQDQLSSSMRFEVFDGPLTLAPPPAPKVPLLTDGKPVKAPVKRAANPEVIDIECEVMTGNNLPIASLPRLCLTKDA